MGWCSIPTESYAFPIPMKIGNPLQPETKEDRPRSVTPKSLTTVVSPEEETRERVPWQRARATDASH
jgi:hypothetical protein